MADSWQCCSWLCTGGADGGLFAAVLYRALDLELADMKTINELWQQSQNDAEGMRLGYTTQQHYFAELVAAAEREACAKVCDDHWNKSIDCGDKAGALQCVGIRTSIRARGNT